MRKIIATNLIPVIERTALEVDIYSSGGDLLFEGICADYDYKQLGVDAFENGVYFDEDFSLTYFLICNRSATLIGVIYGANEICANYAVMIAKIIEGLTFSVPRAGGELAQYLAGELNSAQTERLVKKYAKGFRYFVLALYPTTLDRIDELTEFLSAAGEKNDITIVLNDSTALFLKCADETSDYASANELAHLLYASILEETRIRLSVAVGGMTEQLSDLKRVCENAEFAFRAGRLFDRSVGVYSYKEYMAVRVLSQIPTAALEEFLSQAVGADFQATLDDEELMQAADEFLNNSLNISEASRSLYLHRNTLIYRLDKIEKATGLNLRRFSDAAAFRLIIALKKLCGKADRL